MRIQFPLLLTNEDEQAADVADRLVDFTRASFDGTFIAAQFDRTLVHLNAMDTLADSIASLGQALLATLATPSS